MVNFLDQVSEHVTDSPVRGVDQVHEDIANPRHLEQYLETKAAEDLPGLGRHYCLECAKWFDTEYNLVDHRKGKPHKRRYVETHCTFWLWEASTNFYGQSKAAPGGALQPEGG